MASVRLADTLSDRDVSDKAHALARALAVTIEGQSVTVNQAVTALAMLVASATICCDDNEFEAGMSCFVQAVRINRAQMQAPPRAQAN